MGIYTLDEMIERIEREKKREEQRKKIKTRLKLKQEKLKRTNHFIIQFSLIMSILKNL